MWWTAGAGRKVLQEPPGKQGRVRPDLRHPVPSGFPSEMYVCSHLLRTPVSWGLPLVAPPHVQVPSCPGDSPRLGSGEGLGHRPLGLSPERHTSCLSSGPAGQDARHQKRRSGPPAAALSPGSVLTGWSSSRLGPGPRALCSRTRRAWQASSAHAGLCLPPALAQAPRSAQGQAMEATGDRTEADSGLSRPPTWASCGVCGRAGPPPGGSQPSG